MKKFSISVFTFFIFSIGTGQEDILLKNYDPISVYETQKSNIEKAKYPIIDMHSHPYASTPDEIESWIKTMDAVGIQKSVVLTYQTGKAFDSIYNIYSKYKGRFEIFCGFDFTGYKEKGWAKKAVKELERCYKTGARGVGELGDKGAGLLYSKPTAAYGMHIDDERMKPLLEKCGELGMPISIHVAEPYWMYLPIDRHNDGLMNAAKWKIDTSNKKLLMHDQLIETLENAVRENPETTFIACHFANCSYDLRIIGRLLDTYPNLYADIAARYAETAPVPRYTKKFYEKHQDRLLYGTDMGFERNMYLTTFRILESEDEHFYQKDLFSYHWPLYGLGLSEEILKKIYRGNAQKILK
ncbi:amidohydrolase [Flavobacteriaceae bacterium F89]|uniref:Amidohydrolase n=1 Tax=Cerina litoralis TaxID=2874477 RepID=A0AAE3EW85_9FLAO|nr:amidohydrolase family protein [Cerina litoralis]MCG2461665.1 amidohydrolase [Cerina litoralis]